MMTLKKRTKYILFGILFFIIIGAIYGYLQYTRKNADLSGAKADIVVSATQLFSEYSQNEKAANAKYFDKIINVRGLLKTIDKDHTGTISLGLDAGDPMGGVSCELDARHSSDAGQIHTGDSVTVTGTCAGLLTDVVLNRCALVK